MSQARRRPRSSARIRRRATVFRSRPAGRRRLTTPTHSGRIAPGSRGRYPRRAKPGKEPAGTEDRFGIAMRGRIQRGYYADITLFDAERMVGTAAFDDPREHPASIPYVPVNGQVAVDNDRCTVLAGRRCHKSGVPKISRMS